MTRTTLSPFSCLYCIFIALIFAASSSAQTSPSEVTFKVSTLTPAQVERLYTLAAPNYSISAEGEIIAVKSPQSSILKSNNPKDAVFNSSQLTVWHMVTNNEAAKKQSLLPIETTISQALGGDKYLINESSDMIVVPGNDHLVEGDILRGMAQRDGNYEYTTVTGAPRRIRKLRLADQKPPSKDAFLNALKGGLTMYFVYEVAMKCPYCSGLGEVIGPATGQYNDHFYIKCPDCKGKRTLNEGQLNKLVW